MAETQVCSKCGRERPLKDYYKKKDGSHIDLCKDCLLEHVNNRDPDTFCWILERFDVPYIEKVWIEQCNRIFNKNPSTFSNRSVLGVYVRLMNNLAQYKSYNYADSDRLNYAQVKKEEDEQAFLKERVMSADDLKKRYEAGEITKAEYETRAVTQEDIDKKNMPQLNPGIALTEITPIEDQLSPEDIQYLWEKWGRNYSPEEWVEMEKMYNQYIQEYEMTVDREITLKTMCKTALKVNQALDLGDVNSAKQYGAMLESLRKSGKFTEAQKKEVEKKEARPLDSVGEIVALVEKHGGIIPEYVSYEEAYPKDRIDYTEQDLQNYTRRLVTEDLGLGSLIENYIAKLEEQEEMRKQEETNLFASVAPEEDSTEADKFHDYLQEGIGEDAEKLLQEFGGAEHESESDTQQ